MRVEQDQLSGWGRFRGIVADTVTPADGHDLAYASLPNEHLIARGLGRSYGDAAQINGGCAVVTAGCTDVAWVDRAAGLLRVEAGVTIGHLIDRFAPKGWFVPVTPGTRSVTVGGAIAADIHGKNHHVDGSFTEHVRSLRLRLASNEIITVSPSQHPEVFWATAGGMGLTGIVVDAVLAMKAIPTSTVAVETQRFASLEPLLNAMRASDLEHDFSVAWVDLLKNARSVLTQGSFATPSTLAKLRTTANGSGVFQQPWAASVALPPMLMPRVAVTPGVRVFNEMWWRKAPTQPTLTAESITGFFHPLDAIRDWNRVYGRTGFVQWQCVVPDDASDTLSELVARFATLPSYFTVLKRFGAANQSPLSFPAPGWTLAVDLPATDRVLTSLSGFDQLTAHSGGRVYLAKDARMARTDFESMYPRLAEFKQIRSRVDPGNRFASDLSLRLGL